MVIFLIGYMSSGKSYLGALAARALNVPFYDLDTIIEEKYNKRVKDIFIENGEEYFRQIEHETLVALNIYKDSIIATGGGTPCFHDNMNLISSKGKSVYLQVSINELFNRLKLDKNRPLLQNDFNNLYSFIDSQLNIREPIYLKSDYLVSLDDRSINKLLNLLKTLF